MFTVHLAYFDLDCDLSVIVLSYQLYVYKRTTFYLHGNVQPGKAVVCAA